MSIPLVGQLDEARRFQLDLRPRAPVVRAAPPSSPDARPTAAVLLLSRSADLELGALQHTLRQVGIPVVRLDADDLEALELSVDLAAGTVRLGAALFRPTVTWIRHFGGEALAGRHSAVRTHWRRESWSALPRQLACVSATLIGSSGPGAAEQLATATRLGIATPRTLITTCLADASALAGAKVVLKSLDRHFVESPPGILNGIFADVRERADLVRAGHRLDAPVLLQEYVEHDRELRVYHLAGELVAYQVDKRAPADPWRDTAGVRARLVEAPPAVRAATLALAREWGLVYAAFDFLVRAQEPVFLEANPDGDWRWLESGAGPVTRAAVRMIRARHAPETTVDVVTFLAGGGGQHGR
ncbi:RimK family alpha-L-glutamate ligase [Nonomuraea purpurea]|uniref:RimK family alpha-L-glutamate ligase n=1 Tax=Nonomuraea purpurea TaxID=1849276 RepID=A0ABV8G8U9_9ACTN